MRGIRLTALLLLCAVILGFAGCTNPPEAPPFDAASIQSFRDIPGITEAEIAAIETLQARGEPLIYAASRSTELFERQDGTMGGYTALLCIWLSELFGVEFRPEIQGLGAMLDNLRNGGISFATLSDTPERRQTFLLTDPIAQRSVVMLRAENSQSIDVIIRDRLPRYVFVENSVVTDLAIEAMVPDSFEKIIVPDEAGAYRALADGAADAFIATNTMEAAFDHYGSVHTEDFLPLIFLPAAMVAGHQDYEPVISLVTKMLENGAYGYLTTLYKQGYQDYRRHKFSLLLNEEETEYLRDNRVMPFATQYMSYPYSFYDTTEGRWEGVVFDVMDELSWLTGLTFDQVNDDRLELPELLALVERGEAYFMPNMIISHERRDRFIFSSHMYLTDRFALLSKRNYPNIEMNDIPYERVGLAGGTAFADMFHSWFPNALYAREYPTTDDAFLALDRGEVDFVLSSKSRLTALTNYYEYSDYKANFLFNTAFEATFGFNKDKDVLRSIVNKALPLIDSGRIVEQWVSRTYNIEIMQLRAQRPWLIGAAVLSFIVLVPILIMLGKNRRMASRLLVAVDDATEANRLKQTSLNALESILNSIDGQIYTTSPGTGKILFINDQLKTFFGIEGDSAIGRYCYEVFRGLDNRCSFCPCFELEKNPDKTVVWEEYLPGHKRYIRHSDRYIDWPDGNKVHLQLAVDMTEMVHDKEQAEQSNRSKSAFLAHMSHEIRTPMNAVIGLAELALREHSLSAARDHIASVKQAGANLLSIINNILDFSKIETGNLRITPMNYLLSSLLNDVISITRMKIIDTALLFTVNVDSRIPDALIGDEPRIRQILVNLLDNATKYTDRGYVSFTVRGETAAENSVTLTMEIADSGRGIKQEDVDNLFGEYIRVDTDLNNGIEGVGLGLTITKRLVSAMGGDITVQSEYGKGSTFTVTLPQKIHTPKKLASVENPQDKRALIYETREIYAKSIADSIENLGSSCVVAANDDELRGALAAESFDFIFTSLKLYEQSKELLEPAGTGVKIVLLAEFGETIPVNGPATLSMPVYSLSLAQILNGGSDRFSYRESGEATVRFVAPDAKVLVVDDINTNLVVAKGLLLPYQLDIDLRNSGIEAIKAVQMKDYDAVFMDHKMHKMDGVEAARRIRELEGGKGKNLPIIMLTANAVAGMREKFLESGFDDFLSKPINTVKLNEVLERWIPKEKQQIPFWENSERGPSGTDDSPFEIEGLNYRKGISISGGSPDYYAETLATFHADALERIPALQECLDSGDLSLYGTYIHALKSAAAGIGADELSEMAASLESMAKRGDPGAVKIRSAGFIKGLTLMLEQIETTITAYEKKTGIPVSSEMLFKSTLIDLKMALIKMDADTINRTADLLQRSSGENHATAVKLICNSILMAEYDNAASLIDDLLP